MLHNSGQRENSLTLGQSHTDITQLPPETETVSRSRSHPYLSVTRSCWADRSLVSDSFLGVCPLPTWGRCHCHTATSHSRDLGHWQQLQPLKQGLPIQELWRPRLSQALGSNTLAHTSVCESQRKRKGVSLSSLHLNLVQASGAPMGSNFPSQSCPFPD